MKKTTLKDVADAVGISVAAVSMVLSGKGKMSPAVSDKVRAIAKDMGYAKRASSAIPGNKRFKYVCILQREDFTYLWNFSLPFVFHLEELVIQMGYNPIIIHIQPNSTRKMLFKEILGARVGALFSIHYVDPKLFSELEEAGIPVIIINNCEYQTEFYSVLSDEVQGSFEATSRLVELGHRRIGYAEYRRPEYPSLVKERFFGFRRAVEEHQLRYSENDKITVELSDYDELKRRVRDIYASPDPPSAWVVHDDFFAAYLLEALRAIGKTIPKDISLIASGGDVLDYSLPFIPKIDTMQEDQRMMVSMAWSLLESRLQSPSDTVQVLKTKMPFVDRGSCRFDMD